MKGILTRLVGSRRARVAALLAVALAAAGFTILGLWLSGGGTERALSEQLEPPLTADDFWPDKQGVLHFCAVPGEGPDWPAGTCATEIWFDPRNQRARADIRNKDGTLESIAIVDGDNSAEYKRGESIKIRRVLSNADWYWQQWLMREDHLVAFEPSVTRGMANVIDTNLDGVPALRIQGPGLGEGGKQIATRTIYLDKETHLPIRMETEPADEAANSVKAETQTFVYRVVEWLPMQAVDPALFTLPQNLPPVPRMERDWEMTVEEARAFSSFDIYWPGESVAAQTLVRTAEFERTWASGPTHNVRFDYKDWATPDEWGVSVSNDPADTIPDFWDNPVGMPGAPGTEVTVAGTRGLVFISHSGAQLRLQLGDTLITINGDTEDQVLSVGQALQKLN